MANPGSEVTLEGSSYAMPTVCARCEAPATLNVPVSRQQSRTTRTIQIPICAPCAGRRKAIFARRRNLTLAVLGTAVATAFLGALLPVLPMAALIAVPTLAVMTLAIALHTVHADHLATPNAVWMTWFNPSSTRVYCTNPQWAEKLAAANGTSPQPKERSDTFRHTPWVVGVLVALPLSAYVAHATHPSIHVDSQSPRDLQIWIDGGRSIVAHRAKKGEGEPPEVRVPYGQRRLGYSAVGASAPEATVDVRVKWSGDHLYNPGRTACYLLEATAYGKASTDGISDGPQPIAEFYTFHSVDNWFRDNPKSISTKSSGETRVALNRMESCVQMTDASCPLAARERLVECFRKAFVKDDEKAYSACMDVASAEPCGEDAAPSAAK